MDAASDRIGLNFLEADSWVLLRVFDREAECAFRDAAQVFQRWVGEMLEMKSSNLDLAALWMPESLPG